MRQFFSKADLRDLSLAMAVVMMVATLPVTAGIVVVSRPSGPELTANICQPIQMFDRASNTLLARPAAVAPEVVLRDLGSAAIKETVRLVDIKIAPDTPPPKSLV